MSWQTLTLVALVFHTVSALAQSTTLTDTDTTQCGVSGIVTTSRYQISGSEAAKSLGRCGNFTGNLFVNGNASASALDYDLTGLSKIYGGLEISNLTAGSVTSATPLDLDFSYYLLGKPGSFHSNLTVLSAAAWQEADYNPPSGYTYPSNATQQNTVSGGSLAITNCSRTSANFLALDSTTVTFRDNPFLANITLSGRLKGGNTSISGNGASVEGGVVVDLSNMTSVGNLDLQGIGAFSMDNTLDSGIVLKQIDGSVSITNNSFERFEADSLSSVVGSLTIVNNSNLLSISLPSLNNVQGDFTIDGNHKLNETFLWGTGDASESPDLELPSLNYVKGALTLYGNFRS